MRKIIKLTAAALWIALMLALAGCGDTPAPGSSVPAPGSSEPSQPEASSSAGPGSSASLSSAEPASYRIAALKGPTAMGLVWLMNKMDQGRPASNDYAFTLAASPDEITPALLQGELDMACIPANLASVLYNKSGGQIVTLAVNTLGVLYIVELGGTVRSLADLRGKTIAAAGKGATPEYALRYLLQENGVDPDKDVTVDWKSEHSECVAALAAGQASIALLPQPFVTVAQGKLSGLRAAVDLNDEWDALDNGSALLTGVVAARKEVVEENPEAVRNFLRDYKSSVTWVNENVSDAAALIGEYGIVDAAVAEKAIPYCHIVCETGTEMKEMLSGYLRVLVTEEPKSVGGELPGSEFYFDAE